MKFYTRLNKRKAVSYPGVPSVIPENAKCNNHTFLGHLDFDDGDVQLLPHGLDAEVVVSVELRQSIQRDLRPVSSNFRVKLAPRG
jgi:hypothetical protein